MGTTSDRGSSSIICAGPAESRTDRAHHARPRAEPGARPEPWRRKKARTRPLCPDPFACRFRSVRPADLLIGQLMCLYALYAASIRCSATATAAESSPAGAESVVSFSQRSTQRRQPYSSSNMITAVLHLSRKKPADSAKIMFFSTKNPSLPSTDLRRPPMTRARYGLGSPSPEN